jgi:CheY-like chemotaxis protein
VEAGYSTALESHATKRAVSALVIDDDPEALELFTALLTRHGFSVVTARDGREGLARLDQVRPDVIFVDVRMPIMDGAEFRQAQRRNREWVRIPTVVMTGIADEPVLDVGIAKALRKPVRSSEILGVVRRYSTPRR